MFLLSISQIILVPFWSCWFSFKCIPLNEIYQVDCCHFLSKWFCLSFLWLVSFERWRLISSNLFPLGLNQNCMWDSLICTFSHSVWAVLKWCQCADSRAKSKRDIMLKKQKLNISLSRFLDMYSANAMASVEVRNSTPTTEEDYLTTWNFNCCNGDNESETIKQMLLL